MKKEKKINQKRLKVAIDEFPPLVYTSEEKPTGFEVELWEKIAKELKLSFRYIKYNFKNIIPALQKNKVDIGFAGITRTEEREEAIDFSHHTLDSNLAILVSRRNKSNVWAMIKDLFFHRLRKLFIILLMLFAFIIAVAHIIWLVERGQGTFNPEYFTGILETCWWLFVSISTVGYGDFVPATWLGKFVGVFIILVGLGVFGIYIGQISSLFTLKRMESDIKSHEDLAEKKVATVKHTVSEEVLRKLNAKIVLVNKIKVAYKKLERHEIDAIVFDAPVLFHYLNNEKHKNFTIIEKLFYPQHYGFVFSEGNPLREKINRAILKLEETGEYKELYKKWFGDIFTV